MWKHIFIMVFFQVTMHGPTLPRDNFSAGADGHSAELHVPKLVTLNGNLKKKSVGL